MSKDIQDISDVVSLPPIGARASRSRTITEADVVLFAGISGDHNPIHMDAQYAAQTPFQQRIAHGSLIGAMISAVLGNDLPGHGAIYLGQTLKFIAPVHIGDTVTVTVEVIGIREDKHLITLRTDCTNQEGKLVLTGEALVKFARDVSR